MPKGSEIVVVVMEQGAAWPDCIEACRSVTPDTVIIAQNDGEGPEALTRRVQARLAALQQEDRPVRAAVVAVSRRSDAVAFESRSTLARSLLRAVNSNTDAGTLWLSACNAMPEAARHHLIALAGTLTSLLGDTRTSIAVRFADRRSAGEELGVHVLDARRPAGSLATAS